MKSNNQNSRRFTSTEWIAAILLSFFFLNVSAQVKQPYGWYRADFPGSIISGWNNYAPNVSQSPSSPSQALPSKCLLNFNDSYQMDGKHPGITFHIDSMSNHASIMIVYQSDSKQSENGLWKIDLADNKSLQLTSRSLKHLNSKIDYSDSTYQGPLLNASYLSWAKQSDDSASISFAAADSAAMSGKIPEFIFFPERLDKTTALIWQSYLAIKYGITLINTNYLSSKGDTIWDMDVGGIYNKDIAGIGRDTLFKLHQKQSHSFSDAVMISKGAPQLSNTANSSTINQGDYIIWSNNGNSLSTREALYLLDTNINALLERVWMVQRDGNSSSTINTSLCFDAKVLSSDSIENCRLIISPTGDPLFSGSNPGIHSPDSISSDSLLYFNNIYWDTDASGYDLFTIAIKEKKNKEELVKTDSVEENTYQGPTQAEDISVNNNNNTYKIYPNPTTGMFRIEVQCQDETDIDVKIFDNTGKLFHQIQDKGSDTYYFDRSMTIPGIYQVTITTETQKETLQLVIR